MKRIHRLGRGADLNALLGRGRRIRSPFFDLVVRQVPGDGLRFVFVVPKSVAKRAVVRNRLRRRAREYVRRELVHIRTGRDIGLMIRKEAVAATKKDFYGALKEILARI